MIQQTSFLGISLRTLTRRRAVVLGYYFLIVGFASVPLYLHRPMTAVMLMQTFTWAGLLGGIKFGGPVKPYTESLTTAGLDGSGITQLNLTQSKSQGISQLLDERELHQRDHAHYIAFRILRWSSSAFSLLFWVVTNLAPRLVVNNSSTLLWLLLMYVLSLPQSVILWTEPEPFADASLTLVHT